MASQKKEKNPQNELQQKVIQEKMVEKMGQRRKNPILCPNFNENLYANIKP